MDWTKTQKEVIDHNSGDLLVAAAAGSGKTAVLVERIKRLIIEEEVDVSKFLIVTFTRAAASEMKEKIIDAISKAHVTYPEKRDYLSKQLEKLPTASISTFDSFAAEVVREYFYVIDIDPGLAIAAAEDTAIMKQEAIDEVMSDIYEEGDPVKIAFLNAYSSPKGDGELKKAVMFLCDEMNSMPESIDWMKDAIEKTPVTAEEFENSNLAAHIGLVTAKTAEEAKVYFEEVQEILLDHGLSNLAESLKYDVELCDELIVATPTEAMKILSNLSFPNLSAKGEEREPYKDIKDEVSGLRNEGKKIITKNIRDTFYGEPLETQLKDMEYVMPFARTLYEILGMYREKYREKKRKKGLMDFSDLNHFAIKILENDDVATELREKFSYIFVDEYQDSNYLQEKIIASIKRDDNLFMVGDIKQSIYGFRMAEPDIFKERYALYKQDNSVGSKIDLNSNFRSKNSIIETVNGLFQYMMDDYDDDAKLYRGDKYSGRIHHKTELHIIDREENDKLDDELRILKNVEVEAKLAADLVAKSLGMEIYDSKAQVTRRLEKKDIVILLRNAVGRTEKYYNALMDIGIEAYIDDKSGYFDTIEISTFLDLLRIIDNRRQDIPLLSVLRSGIFDFSIDDLIKIRLSDISAPFHMAFFNYDKNDDLGGRISRVKDFLDTWNYRQTFMPVDKLSWNLMIESGYFDYVGALPAGRRRQGNLIEFTQKAAAYGESSEGSLSGLIQFMEASSFKVDTGQAPSAGEGEDAVRIMTIHKSKGLEFPMVIVSGIGESKQGAKDKKEGVWHKDIGFALQKVDAEKKIKKKTLIEKGVISKRNMDAMEEEIRIFYVACTRAKDKLVLIGSESARAKDSYLSLMLPDIDENTIDVIHHTRQDVVTLKSGEKVNEYAGSRIAEFESAAKKRKDKNVDQILSFTYPHKEDLDFKSKYSVSELNKTGEDTYILRTPTFGAESEELTAATLGSVIHKVMECLDFKAVMEVPEADRVQFVENEVERMVLDGLLDEKEAAAVNTDRIVAFFSTDIGIRAVAADEMYKEKHFNIIHNLEGKDVILQGVIDCYFVDPEDGKIVLLDYKNSRISQGIEDVYRKQIQLYKEALEKATGKEVKESYLYLFGEDKAVSL